MNSASVLTSIKRWFDNSAPDLSAILDADDALASGDTVTGMATSVAHSDVPQSLNDTNTDPTIEKIDWLRVTPFVLVHLACLSVFFVGWSYLAVSVAIALYLLRMFAITAFYHRYFAHKAFKTSRTVQFIFGVIGAASTQRGPLWWAAHHRHHHRHSDTELDTHSPRKGFLWSHMGWFLSSKYFNTQWRYIKDYAKFPELVWLDRFDMAVPLALSVLLYCAGFLLEVFAPELGTNGAQMVVWGYLISTVVLFHATVSINSLAHKIGTKTFPTNDDSRNNVLLALITLGEGWHNNHHFAPGTVRQGFRWWQVDISYYVLRFMAVFGLVWDLKPIPSKVEAFYQQQRDSAKGEGS